MSGTEGIYESTVQTANNNYNSGETKWRLSQVSDEGEVGDIISCLEFNHDGEFLATGDKGGRIDIFQKEPPHGKYVTFHIILSHGSINKVRWLDLKSPSKFLLSTNNKTVKLWKIAECEWEVQGFNVIDDNGNHRDPSSITSIRVPVVKRSAPEVKGSLRRSFAKGHEFTINSISLNSDKETFLSADDLRINLWNLETTNQSFNIVDLKPATLEEVTEVITAAQFQPNACNVFVYGSTNGSIRLCDMREAALCDKHSKLFEEPANPFNLFSIITSCISDVQFSYSGRYMVSRDYLYIKIWDLHMESRPLESFPVHGFLHPKLCSLYDEDHIFDQFECCWNGSDSAIMTGSYNNIFRLFDRKLDKDYILEATRDVTKRKNVLKSCKMVTGPVLNKNEVSVDSLDFSKKILHTAWHPKENIIAVAATNSLFLFQGR